MFYLIPARGKVLLGAADEANLRLHSLGGEEREPESPIVAFVIHCVKSMTQFFPWGAAQ